MFRTKVLSLILVVCLSCTLTYGSAEKEPGKKRQSKGPGWGVYGGGSGHSKPFRVLLIGDSIMQGYRGTVKKHLSPVADVDVWATPVHLNTKGVHEKLKSVLSKGPYDVVHFNIGLHGLSEDRVPSATYEQSLRKYADAMVKNSSGAVLIWGSITPVMTGKGENPRQLDEILNGKVKRRNEIALKVMKEYKIAVNDLYALMLPNLALSKGDPYHWRSQGMRLQGEKISETIAKAINNNFKYISLTFDDGPLAKETPVVLAALAKEKVRATFFLIGKNASRYPEIVKQIFGQGHEIGNHTLTHADLTKLASVAEVLHEIAETQKILKGITGKNPKSFRAPWLKLDKRAKEKLKKEGLFIYGMDRQVKDIIVDSTKGDKPVAAMEKIKSGQIILMHDKSRNDIRYLPKIISELKTKGFRFLTCSQLRFLSGFNAIE